MASPSEENVALTRAAVDAFNRGDREALLELVADDFVFDWTRSESPMQGIYRGREGLSRLLDEQWKMFDEFVLEPEAFIVRGNHVVVPNTVRARGRGGVEVSATSAHVYTFEDGRAVRVTLINSGRRRWRRHRRNDGRAGVACGASNRTLDNSDDARRQSEAATRTFLSLTTKDGWILRWRSDKGMSSRTTRCARRRDGTCSKA
jgi:ketosteroid isomerase-like protein